MSFLDKNGLIHLWSQIETKFNKAIKIHQQIVDTDSWILNSDNRYETTISAATHGCGNNCYISSVDSIVDYNIASSIIYENSIDSSSGAVTIKVLEPEHCRIVIVGLDGSINASDFDKTELNKAIVDNTALYNTQNSDGYYNDSTWTTFAEAYENAVKVNQSTYVTENQIIEAEANLVDARDNLSTDPDVTVTPITPTSDDFLTVGYLRMNSNSSHAGYIIRSSTYTTTMGPFPKSGMVNIGAWNTGTQTEYDRACLKYANPSITPTKVTMVFNTTDGIGWEHITGAKLYAVTGNYNFSDTAANIHNIAKSSNYITLDSSITEYDITSLYNTSIASATNPSFMIIAVGDNTSPSVTRSQYTSVYAPSLRLEIES